jgi:hypothetical protein
MVRTTHLKRDNLGHIYLGFAGVDLPLYLTEYYRTEKQAQVREDLVRFAGPAARWDDRVLELAALALTDRSRRVRQIALWLFALAGDPSRLSLLRAWHPGDSQDAEYRERAIRAIENQDAQEWVRDTPYSAVIPWQFTRHEAGSASFMEDVDRYVKRFAADLVPDLERVLGDVYLAH